MTKEARLKREAREGATWRGHKMTPFQPYSPGKFYSGCVRCGRSVSVTLRPLPNEIDIAGEAVAVGCLDELPRNGKVAGKVA